ncbi:hypothetical protein K490DRAFT_54110 [Saccharata proteae CBS 121410]|uniref:Cupin type-1 domain-containing protein n=1 Tax=Saccharata proteae CBS 121410 TaxID=1314787 RepID=A0A9P4I3K5_9PEZI|nr:hypothetical protein K490DRAFT_54110 [Saccharata proteae CBS 121410]
MPPAAPETYHFSPTPHVPNSTLPVLLYRNVLPHPPDAASVQAFIEPNRWLRGGVFKTVTTHHFHSLTHECYAVFRGSSTLLLGRGPLDCADEAAATVVEVEEGDVIILPAGVAHCSLDSAHDYEYMGLYPEGSPHWDNNWCKADAQETAAKAANAAKVPVPSDDPIYGRGGPLCSIWGDFERERGGEGVL